MLFSLYSFQFYVIKKSAVNKYEDDFLNKNYRKSDLQIFIHSFYLSKLTKHHMIGKTLNLVNCEYFLSVVNVKAVVFSMILN